MKNLGAPSQATHLSAFVHGSVMYKPGPSIAPLHPFRSLKMFCYGWLSSQMTHHIQLPKRHLWDSNPCRGDPSGLACQRLNRLAKVSLAVEISSTQTWLRLRSARKHHPSPRPGMPSAALVICSPWWKPGATVLHQGMLPYAHLQRSRKSTHRGARTHDHKVKGLALCRLS